MQLLPDRRDDLFERRRRLRFLDVLLLAEIDFLGSVHLAELVGAVEQGPNAGHLRLSCETIHEWWEDAARRRLLEEVVFAGVLRFGLTDRGARRLDAARASDVLDHRPLLNALRRLAAFVLPSAAAFTAFVALADKETDVLLYGAIIVGAVAVGLLVAVALTLAAKPLWDKVVRSAARNNADWLEGRPMAMSLLGWTVFSLPARPARRLPLGPASGDREQS